MRQQAGRLLWCILAVLMIGATTPNVGHAQTTTRVSIDIVARIPNGVSYEPVPQCRWAICSLWIRMPAIWWLEMENEIEDVFVYDRQRGTRRG